MLQIIAILINITCVFATEKSYSLTNSEIENLIDNSTGLMKAIICDGHGGPEVLQEVLRPFPKAKEDEVLIEVAFSAMNRADLMQRKGLYPAPKGATDILGLEVSGWIVNLDGTRSDQKVIALLPGGGYA